MGSQANIQLNSVSYAPGLEKQPSREEVAPAHSKYSLTWLPNSHKTMFSFSTEPWREARETLHTARAQLLFGDGAELPAASVALIMRSCDLLRADCSSVMLRTPRAFSSFNEDRILLGRDHNFFHFTMEGLAVMANL